MVLLPTNRVVLTKSITAKEGKVEQANIFDEGKELRDKGIKQAAQHAEDEYENWHEKASQFLFNYARTHKEFPFSGEMVRNASRDKVPRPPSLRAWGSVMVYGLKVGWIKQVGYVKVVNPKAHRANAALWESCI